MPVRRHPFLGAFGGILVGLGIGLLFVMFEFTPADAWTIIASIAFFGIMGFVYALLMPPPSVPRS